MELQTVARCYAQALFNLNKTQEAKELLVALTQLWKNAAFVQMVKNPLIPLIEKSNIIIQLFMELPEYAQNFIKLLCEKKRFNCIKAIDKEFNKLVAKVENINYVKIEAANLESWPLHDELQHKLEQILNSKVALKIKRNMVLIAGAKITLNESAIDSSFKAMYDNLHTALLAN